MPVTGLRGRQVLDGDITRSDINTSTAGSALIARIIAGTNISITSTGADSGTGDVTISATGTGLNGTGFVRMNGAEVSYITGTAAQFVKANGTLDSSVYLTSYTETDTLATVTGRGATTTTLSNFNGGINMTGATSSTGLNITSSINSGSGSVIRIAKAAAANQAYISFDTDQLFFGTPSNNTTDADVGTKGSVNLRLQTNYTTRINIGPTGTIRLVPLTSNGFLKTSGGDGTLTVDTATYLTGNQTITLSGDATGSGATAITVTLANSGVAAGTYTKVTVDAKGRVTTGASLLAADIPALNYLPIGGGTLTGNVIVWPGSNASYGAGFKFRNDTYAHYSIGVKGSSFVLSNTGSDGTVVWPVSITDLITVGTSGNTVIAGTVTASSIIKSGGTSSQFLKADGSVDSTTYQSTSQKGQANGYASLDGAGKVPIAQLPSSIMEYKGTWNASTNSPTLADGTGDTGDVYRVSTAGTRNLGSGSITFDVGDYVIYNGTVWEKSDTTDAVASVNGLTGVITLTTTNIGEGTNLYYTDTRARAAITLTTTGTSGAATYSGGVLNIPQYQAAGSYLTAESDTLATVTARGASTNTSITVGPDLVIQADGSVNYTASRLKLNSHNNYRGAGMHLTGVDSNWFIGTPYTDFSGGFVIARKSSAASFEDTAQYSNALFTVKSDGKVGIGTTSVTAKLHVVANSNQDGFFVSAADSSPFNAKIATFRYAANGNDVNIEAQGGKAAIQARAGASTMDLLLNAAGGYVGIGTTTPATPLHVLGGPTGTGSWNKTATLAATYPGLIFNSNGTKWGGIAYDFSAGMRFWVNASNDDIFAATNAVSILNNGNVGINSSAPTFKLEVGGTTYLNGNVSINTNYNGFALNVSGTTYVISGHVWVQNGYGYTNSGSTATGMYPDSNHNIDFKSNNSSAIYINSSRNIGINTTSPVSKLEVYSNLNASTFTGITVTNGAGANTEQARAGIAFKGYDWVQSAIWHGRNTSAGLAGALVFGTNPDTTDLTVNGVVGRMWILNNGNVGIATSSPAYRFQVQGPSGDWAIYAKGSLTANNSYGLFIDAGTSAADSPFMVRSADGTTTFLRIQGGGNIGILTASPANKLQIGSVGSSGYGGNDIAIGNGTQVMAFYQSSTISTWYTNTSFSLMPSGAGSTGNLGVGTTSPNYRLDVRGNIALGDTSTNPQIIFTGASVNGFTNGYISWNAGTNSTAALTLSVPGNNFEVVTGYNERVVLSTGAGLYVYTNNGSGTYTNRLTLDRSGNLTISGTLTEQSALRYKENIAPVTAALEKVDQLKPVSYNKKGSVTKEIGLIAEDVFDVYPEFVLCDDNGEPVGIHYSRLTAVLIESVKELKTRIQELEKRN